MLLSVLKAEITSTGQMWKMGNKKKFCWFTTMTKNHAWNWLSWFLICYSIVFVIISLNVSTFFSICNLCWPPGHHIPGCCHVLQAENSLRLGQKYSNIFHLLSNKNILTQMYAVTWEAETGARPIYANLKPPGNITGTRQFLHQILFTVFVIFHKWNVTKRPSSESVKDHI